MKTHSLPLFVASLIGLGLIPLASALSPVRAETTDQKVQRLQSELNALADVVESKGGRSNSSSSQTHVGGYGELHYNHLETDDGSKEKDELDFHRFVLFISHDFNERTKFFSELELEHSIAGEGKKGEIELEQAYIEHKISNSLSGKAGMIILPIGIINETHEPPVFYGVERNPVEKNIIPATWWAGGIGLSGHHPTGLSYDAMIHEGLNTPDTDGKRFTMRKGRQKTGKATAKDLAATGRIKYTGLPGLEIGLTGHYQSDFAQGAAHGGSATLLETHAAYQKGKLGIKTLYARWDLDGAAAKSANKEAQDGAYIEASYKVTPKLGAFVRQSQWDNGGAGDTEFQQTDLGMNYWLNDNVVLKADYQNQSHAKDSKASDGFNLGVGYQF